MFGYLYSEDRRAQSNNDPEIKPDAPAPDRAFGISIRVSCVGPKRALFGARKRAPPPPGSVTVSGGGNLSGGESGGESDCGCEYEYEY
jgi:hypothetical protein